MSPVSHFSFLFTFHARVFFWSFVIIPNEVIVFFRILLVYRIFLDGLAELRNMF